MYGIQPNGVCQEARLVNKHAQGALRHFRVLYLPYDSLRFKCMRLSSFFSDFLSIQTTGCVY